MGFGHVGQAFLQVVQDKKEVCLERYGLDMQVHSIFRRSGALFSAQSLNIDEILELSASSPEKLDWDQNLRLSSVLDSFESGILVECTLPGKNGEPGLCHIRSALERGWDVVTANKDPLVADFRGLVRLAEENHACIKFSGATAAALPTVDVALHTLAGAEIFRIEGILNGTTNHILTQISQGGDYQAALEDAISQGIAEPDPTLDVTGWDTAVKILIITNAVLGTNFSLEDVKILGIEEIPPELLEQGKKKDRALKLLGRMTKKKGKIQLEVDLAVIDSSHPLFGVDGTEKGITYFTDTLGSITVTGGKSDPRGTGAALLKDIINIYKVGTSP